MVSRTYENQRYFMEQNLMQNYIKSNEIAVKSKSLKF